METAHTRNMVNVEKKGIILSPTKNDFENNGVINPAVYQDGDDVHLFYRAVAKDNFSTIGYAKANGPTNIVERLQEPLVAIELDDEKHGIEDPRIVKIEDAYYLTYTAYDGINAMGALAVSSDMKHFEKKGIFTPPINYKDYKHHLEHCNQEKLNPKYYDYAKLFESIGLADDTNRLLRDKDIVLFPEKINGKFVLLHRIWPGIQIVYFDDWADLTKPFWEEYLKDLTAHIVLDPKYYFEVNYLGAGCPPIKTKDGWLLIYHGVCETTIGKTYHTAAALLQLDKPEIEISRLPEPLFSPTEKWEVEGVVNHVVFPTGTALFGDDLYIYYGSADEQIAVARVNMNELLNELKKHT
jgi:predicted GH43/DUF377 family glycosyl hydrolase